MPAPASANVGPGSVKVIGVDFDNTIICYDQLFFDLAVKQSLIDRSIHPMKTDIRDAIRRLDNGEIKWQKLQALVYGPMIDQARLFDGVKDFLVLCRKMAVKIYVVSHKNQFAAQDENKCDLRVAALGFLKHQGLLTESHGLSESSIYFESTRQEKIKRIARLKCDIFIDDLPETFLEEGFPKGIQKILFNSEEKYPDLDLCLSVKSWDEAAKWLKAKV